MNKLSFTLLFSLGIYTASTQDLQGFFLNDFQPKPLTKPAFESVSKTSKVKTTTVTVDVENVITPVCKYLFGNNANVYMSQVVDQPALVEHIKTLSPNVIRFPGGNISSVYFWNAEKNQPPTDAPAQIPDANGALQNPGYWYGKNTEGWTMSVDNYYGMLQQTSSTGIITVNYAYARYGTAADPVASAAHLAADWVRYDQGRTKFWEIGNESGGVWQAGYRIKTADNRDGQPEIITGELYGKHFKVFADSMRKAASETGATIYIGAQLLAEEPANWWTDTDKNWNAGVFQQAANVPDYYIIHSYYTPYKVNSKAADILNSASPVTRSMMEYVKKSQQEAGVTIKPLALTEWNIFAEGSKQMASYINGIHAVLVLGELIQNKYGLASRWDLANSWDNGNDHGMFNQGDEPGGTPKWNPRAVYYYMYYFQKYFGDHMVNASVSGSNDIVAYASTFESGEAGVVIVNKGTTEQIVSIDLQNYGYGERFYWYNLTGGNDNGEFSLKVSVNGLGTNFPSGGPANVKDIKARSALVGGGVKITSSPRSVQYVVVDHGDGIIMDVKDKDPSGLKIYPNPGHRKFKIELPAPGFSKCEIIDSKGKLAYRRDIDGDETSFDIDASLTSGVYVVRLFKHQRVIQKKIVVDTMFDR
ncbi:MAG: T9SS type A sorting domain-containing protein [Bacteroidota bacterium]